MKILITGGGCIEPIDKVRSLCNFSTGNTSVFLSEELVKNGAEVTLVQGKNAVQPTEASLRTIRFGSFQDLYQILQKILTEEKFDYIIHAAAVSDYSVSRVETSTGNNITGMNKIDSAEEIVIRLKKNPKIISRLKAWSRNKSVKLIGFKLTRTEREQEGISAVQKLYSESTPDLIVWNDLKDITSEKHRTRIFDGNDFIRDLETKKELADFLITYCIQGDQ